MFSRIWPTALMLSSLLFSACQTGALSTEPAQLTTIRYDYTDAISTVERKMLVDSDGRVRVVQMVGTDGTGVVRADTNLTLDQRDALLHAFRGWKQLKPYYPTSFGPIFSVTFEGYTVEAADSDAAAPELRRVKLVLDAVANAALDAAPRPTLPPTTGPAAETVTYVLQSDIDYQFQYDMSGPVLHRRITVSRDEGLLKLKEETTGTGAQDPAVDVKIHLTYSQLETLADTLKSLPAGDQRYPGIENGPYYQIKYAGRSIISGGLPSTPQAVKSAQLLLEGYAMDAKRFPEDD